MVAVSAPVLVEPDVPTLPHEAVHDVACVLDHVRVELPPYDTAVGFADSATVVGGGATVTVALALAEPPAPLHVMLYVVVAVSAPVLAVPPVDTEPPHDELHDVAFVDDHVSVELAPYAIDVGLAASVTVGAGVLDPTVTVTDAEAVPPMPLHVSVNVELCASEPVLAVPVGGWLPDHAPDAVHDVTCMLVHDSVALPPVATFVGVAVIDTCGSGATHTTVDATVGFDDDENVQSAVAEAAFATRADEPGTAVVNDDSVSPWPVQNFSAPAAYGSF